MVNDPDAVKLERRSGDPAGAAAAHAAGDTAMSTGNWEAAIRAWARLREIAPDNLVGYVRGSEALWRAGQASQADALSAQAVGLFPDSLWPVHWYAMLALHRGDWLQAERRWSFVRDNFPEDLDGYTNGARAAIRAGNYAGAEELISWIATHFPDRPDSLMHKAELAIRRGFWDDAIRACVEMREKFPQAEFGYVRGAEALRDAGRLVEADALSREAMSRFPDSTWAPYVHATLAGHLGKHGEAAERWTLVRERFPLDPLGYIRGADSAVMAGRPADAEEILCDAVQRFANNFDLLARYAESAMRRGIWRVAAQRWASVRQAHPERLEGWIRGAEALRRGGDREQAWALLSAIPARLDVERSVAEAKLDLSIERDDLETAEELWSALIAVKHDQPEKLFRCTWELYMAHLASEKADQFLDALLDEPERSRPGWTPQIAAGLAALSAHPEVSQKVQSDISRRLASSGLSSFRQGHLFKGILNESEAKSAEAAPEIAVEAREERAPRLRQLLSLMFRRAPR